MNYALICQARAAECYALSLKAERTDVRTYWQLMAGEYYKAARQSLGLESAW